MPSGIPLSAFRAMERVAARHRRDVPPAPAAAAAGDRAHRLRLTRPRRNPEIRWRDVGLFAAVRVSGLESLWSDGGREIHPGIRTTRHFPFPAGRNGSPDGARHGMRIRQGMRCARPAGPSTGSSTRCRAGIRPELLRRALSSWRGAALAGSVCTSVCASARLRGRGGPAGGESPGGAGGAARRPPAASRGAPHLGTRGPDPPLRPAGGRLAALAVLAVLAALLEQPAPAATARAR